MGILLVYDVTDERSFNSMSLFIVHLNFVTIPCVNSDIRSWHSNIEQHASEGVNKILIGNKSDWVDKKAVTEEQGRELANEFGIKFMETSAKVNEGVEEAFFTLARSVRLELADILPTEAFVSRDIKTRLIDSQADGAGPQGTSTTDSSVRVNQPSAQTAQGPCC